MELKEIVQPIIQQAGELYVSYKPAIYVFVGWAISLVPDYYFGKSQHKSFGGFIKFLYLKSKGKKDAGPAKE